ncbi:GLPGLI family protein [Bizionia argentinensis]|nr:GLPGLI family protein [Bizionia argentinensis]
MNKFLVILFISTITYSQTVKGIITVNPKHAIGDNTELSEMAKKPMYHSYIYSNKISKQELISKEETIIDTILVQYEDHKELTQETTKALIKSNKIIYFKNFETNIYRLENSRKNRYLVTENTSIKDEIPNYEWVLATDTLTVAGYACKKATTERVLFGRKQHITAWYSDDIPINDGPMAFNGLPGLILQIEIDENNIIKFEKLKFLKEDTEIIEPKNEVPFLSINQYQLKAMNRN